MPRPKCGSRWLRPRWWINRARALIHCRSRIHLTPQSGEKITGRRDANYRHNRHWRATYACEPLRLSMNADIIKRKRQTRREAGTQSQRVSGSETSMRWLGCRRDDVDEEAPARSLCILPLDCRSPRRDSGCQDRGPSRRCWSWPRGPAARLLRRPSSNVSGAGLERGMIDLRNRSIGSSERRRAVRNGKEPVSPARCHCNTASHGFMSKLRSFLPSLTVARSSVDPCVRYLSGMSGAGL